MERLLGIVTAIGWLALISSLWIGAVGLCALFLLQQQFAFNPLSPVSWQMLKSGFQQGQSIPLGFILLCLALLTLGLIGEAAILWRLPLIVARLPSLALPQLRLRLPKPPLRKPLPPLPPSAPKPQAAPPAPEPVAEEIPQTNDSAIMARILALFEVWNEPPPSWMSEALKDEIHLLSPNAWPTLETLGSHGLDLLVTLQNHGMLPESQAALHAIGEVETALRAGLTAEAAFPRTSAPIPLLTLPASWLCEALENFLAAQQDEQTAPAQLTMAQTMLEQAMRGMGEQDWASLDLFPEKAGRVRVLTDRLREDMRRASSAKQAPAHPVEAVIALLERFGFSLESAASRHADAPMLAQRPDLLLLLQTIDLDAKSWRLPQGPLGLWFGQDKEISPGRQLWQLLARRRLRQADHRPLAGLLVLHGGHIEEETALAALAAAERRRSKIGLAWLHATDTPLPALERELQSLTERASRERTLRPAEGNAAAQP